MPSLDQNIRGALQTTALAVAGMPPQSQIEFENKVFVPTVGTPWARMTVRPVSSRPLGVNVFTKRHNGLFSVDLFVPPDTGTAAVESLGNAVKDALAAGSKLNFQGVAIGIDYAERFQAMDQKPNWLMCNVTIRWHCFSSQN